jgi:putative Mn2+ efflux pump MntP
MTQDLFMGIAAALTGLFMLFSAVLNTETFSRFWLTMRIEARFGSNAARVAGALSGITLMLIGALLMLGLLPARSRQVSLAPESDRVADECKSGMPG